MKRIAKVVIKAVMSLWSNVYTYSFSLRIKNWKDSFFTMWFCNFLGSIGNNTLIQYPCRLWGEGGKFISLGNNTTIHANCILGCWTKYGDDVYTPSIKIGSNCSIGEHSHISAINSIVLGDGLLTGQYVYIGDNSHGGLSKEEANIPPQKRALKSKGGIVIGRNVWLGDKVTILSGVTIGDNVIVGANSVVTHDLPSNCMAAGSPAKILKQL